MMRVNTLKFTVIMLVAICLINKAPEHSNAQEVEPTGSATQEFTQPAVNPQASPAATGASLLNVHYGNVSFVYNDLYSQNVQAATFTPGTLSTDTPFWELLSESIKFRFTNNPDDAPLGLMPSLSVFSVMAYEQVNPQVKTTIDELITLLNTKRLPAVDFASLPHDAIPTLPLTDSAQLFQANVRFMTFQGGKGIRFVTCYGQDIGLVTNDCLQFKFVGLTDDGKYILSAEGPLTNPLLPNTLVKDMNEMMSGADGNTRYQKYLTDTIALLNKATSTDFTPNLEQIDALLQTVNITTGQVSTPIGPPTGPITVGQEAIVSADGNEVYVLAGPHRGSSRLTTLLAGQHVLVTGGPVSADGFTWWQVQLIEGRTGWMAEGNGQSTWIQISSDTPTVKVLDGLVASTVYIGARITAGKNTSVPINIRSDPSRTAKQLRTINKTTQNAVIIDGPQNDTSTNVPTRWWKVRLDPDGATGWVQDGEQTLNFIDPIGSGDMVTNVRGDHIKVGDTVHATSTGDGMHLRTDPLTTSPGVTTLGVGVDAKVLAGPAQGEGYTWWQIQRTDGLKGWVGVLPGWLEVYSPGTASPAVAGTMQATGDTGLNQTPAGTTIKVSSVNAVLSGHTDTVWSVAWSPDGKTLASASQDQTVRLWDAASGQALHTLTGHALFVYSVAWSPDGKTLASASEDKTVRLWDAASGQTLRTLSGHSFAVTSVAWSPDGKTLASASNDSTVRLWDAASGQTLRTLSGHTDEVRSVAWSPDGKTLASASNDQTVRLWDAASGQALRTLSGHTDAVLSVAWSPDGKTLASASADGTVRLWDPTSGQALRTLSGHKDEEQSVAWSPDGKTLASATMASTVLLWDAASGQALRTLSGHTANVESVAWSPDGKTLASASDDKTVRLWDVSALR